MLEAKILQDIQESHGSSKKHTSRRFYCKIIPTEDGFNILEINSHGQARNCEAYNPFYLNEYQIKEGCVAFRKGNVLYAMENKMQILF